MKPTPGMVDSQTKPPEPLPWREPDDARGWRVVGVGRRHPRWLEFEIAAISQRHDPFGLVNGAVLSDSYRAQARVVAEQLRRMVLASATAGDVAGVIRDAFAEFCTDQPLDDMAFPAAMVDDISRAWRASTRRTGPAASRDAR